MADFKSRDLRNAKTGGLVTTRCSDLEAATTFAEAFQDQDHWLWYWVHKTIQELPARDADDALDYICDWFLIAVGHGLKKPMIRVHFRDQRFKLYLSERGTLCLKTGSLEGEEDDKSDEPTSYDPTGRERYIGCFLRGQFRVARERRAVLEEGTETFHYRGRRRYQQTRYEDGPDYKLNPTETEFLLRLKADPVGFLAECGREMDRCCYCPQPLEDARSKKMGYGPICAKHWGLPWGTKGGTNTVKAFSEVYNRDCHHLCVAVRLNIGDDHVWGILNDWLTERSALPAKKAKKDGDTRVLHKPEGRFRYPRWDGAAPQRPLPKVCPSVTVPPEPKYEDVPVGVDPNNVPSDKLVWSSSIKTLSVKVSDLGWGEFPPTVVVNSTKTGATRTFTESCRDFKTSELQCVRYASPDGIKLVVHNS